MNQAKDRAPGGDKMDAVKKVTDAKSQGGMGAGAEEAAAQGGAAAARAGASALTGGATDAAGAAAPQLNKAIDKIGEGVGRGAYKATATVAGGVAMLVLAIIFSLTGGMAAVIGVVTGSGAKPPPPTTEQCESMPAGWCDLAYEAQEATHGQDVIVPWTVLSGLARVTTDFGRTSPYDFTDRDALRPTPPYLAANFASADTTGGGNLGTVPYTTDSSPFIGVYENGKIPSAVMCPIAFAPDKRLECGAATAIASLNEKYKADHNGKSLKIVSAYRDYAGQVEQRNIKCAEGRCSFAAVPGKSNHGWGVAVDLGSMGGANDYSQPNYAWMMANGPTFGWNHPPAMQKGGKGPSEPWHWEFSGAAASDAATVAQTSSGPSATLSQLTVSAGVSAEDPGTTNGCVVANPSTDIGGEGRQAAGPFLLLPSAADALRKEGGDPNNPCEAAEFVAIALAEAASDVAAEDGAPERGDDEGVASAFWQKVLSQANVVADPDQPIGECNVTATGLSGARLIESIWTCELTQSPELHVVSGVAQNFFGMGTTFQEYSRATGQSMLIAEAKTVAWNFSQFGAATCAETDTLAGVFPLTAQQASKAGIAERCDPAQNILAAAKLVVAGEQVRVSERPATNGPMSPMLGGWANIPAALGADASVFGTTGAIADWRPNAACMAALETYVTTAARSGSPFASLAAATTKPEDVTTYEAWLEGSAATLTPCGTAKPETLAAEAAVIAQGRVTDQAGVTPARESDSLPAPAVVVPPGDVPDGVMDDIVPVDEPAPATTPAPAVVSPPAAAPTELSPFGGLLLGGGGYSVPVTTPAGDSDAQTMLGLSKWFNWASQAAEVQGPAVFGEHSMIPRLSTTANVPAIGPVDASPAMAATAWQTRVTEWATFYGGLAQPFDTHGQRTGSLVSSLTGVAGAYAALSGDTATQVNTILEAAKRYLGTPYVWGGGGPNGPTSGGFDCSGLTEYAFAQAGYNIGGFTGTQKDTAGTVIATIAEAQAGDLLFFNSPISHVGIYLGDNQMIHAPKPGGVVNIVALYDVPTLIKRVVVPRVAAASAEGGVDAWVATALGVLYANGFPQEATDAANLKTIIMKESSGNPAAVNKVDSNFIAGHPSFGLMQTIPSTFDGHALPAYTDKADPVAQIIAGARYAAARYGSLSKVPGIVAMNQGKPYRGY